MHPERELAQTDDEHQAHPGRAGGGAIPRRPRDQDRRCGQRGGVGGVAAGEGVLRQLHRGRPQIRPRSRDQLLEYGIDGPDEGDDDDAVPEVPPTAPNREDDDEHGGQDGQRQRVGEIGQPNERVLVLRTGEVMEFDQDPPLTGERAGMGADPDRQRDERDADRAGAPPETAAGQRRPRLRRPAG